MEKRKVLKKIGKITGNIILYFFLAVALFAIVMSIVAKKDADGTATIFGIQMRFVQSPSMEKCDETDVSEFDIKDIPTKSMIFVEVVPEDKNEAAEWYSDLEIGDVLTFKYVYVRQETITHRITKITPNSEGGYIIELKGDNKASNSEILTQVIDTSKTTSPNYVIGKVVGQSYPLGLLVYALKSPAGLVCIVILPSLLILFLEVFKLINLFNIEKKKKDLKEREAQKSELDELRKKLAELEEANRRAQGSAPAPEDDNDNGS